jgi:hypothetical protein
MYTGLFNSPTTQPYSAYVPFYHISKNCARSGPDFDQFDRRSYDNDVQNRMDNNDINTFLTAASYV